MSGSSTYQGRHIGLPLRLRALGLLNRAGPAVEDPHEDGPDEVEAVDDEDTGLDADEEETEEGDESSGGAEHLEFAGRVTIDEPEPLEEEDIEEEECGEADESELPEDGEVA